MKRILAKTCLLALCLGATSALAGTVTVNLIDSQGNPISGAAVRTYYEGSKGSTDGTGTLVFTDAKTTDSVYLTYGGHTTTWANQNIAANPTLTAQTTKVTVDLKSCSTGLSLAATLDQWGNLPTFKAYFGGAITGGSIEMLPGTDSFYVDWETKEQTKANVAITDGGGTHQQAITFYTTKVTLVGNDIKFYANSPISGWVSFSGPKEMLQVSWNFTVGGTAMVVDLTSGPCTYGKTILTIKVLKSNGQGQPGATVKWWEYGKPQNGPGTTGANGVYMAVMDGIIGNTAGFGVGVQPAFEDATGPMKFQNPQVNSVYVFQLTCVEVQLVDNTGALITTATPAVTYAPWGKPTRAFGTMVAGKVKKDLLLGGNAPAYNIPNYNNSKRETLLSGSTPVVFQTGKVLDGGFGCTTYQPWFGGLPSVAFVDGIQLLDHGNVFGFSKPGTTKTLRVHPGQTLDINTGLYTTP